jgi:hypothetical protein
MASTTKIWPILDSRTPDRSPGTAVEKCGDERDSVREEASKDMSCSMNPFTSSFTIPNQDSSIVATENMSQKWPDVKAESEAFAAEVKEIESWWQTDRQKHIKRFKQCFESHDES